MSINNLIFLYAAVLMLLSQTLWAQAVTFLAMPLLIIKVNRVNRFVLSKLLYLMLIIVIAGVSSLFHIEDYDLYFLFRDVMYFIQAPMFIVIGALLCSTTKNFDNLLKTIILTSFVVTIFKLSELIINPSLIFQLGLDTRYEYDLSNEEALLALIILLYAKKNQFRLFDTNTERLIIYISAFSVFLSFSRTSYVVFFILLLLPYINSKIVLKAYWILVFFVLFVIFGDSILGIGGSETEMGNTFKDKFVHSLDEIIVHDYDSRAAINENWRGYEAYLGLLKYKEGNITELLFGQGYGAVVFTPFEIFRGEMEMLDVLPMFHNGFITILLKTGLVGLSLYFAFLYTLLRSSINFLKKITHIRQKMAGILLQACVFITFFYTFVIHGIFRPTVPVLLLILIGGVLQFIVRAPRNTVIHEIIISSSTEF